MKFRLVADYQPKGDQPEAIDKLVESLDAGTRYQTLLGVTGSGKTFTMANLIEKLQRPALVISHNKTLAAQLYSEFQAFFPDNAVKYFVSYYDYYQPEAYVPQTDTFIEKDSSINEEIEQLRIASTSSLIEQRDVIVVASVSCIYGLGSPEDYRELSFEAKVGEDCGRDALMTKLVECLYERNDYDLKSGCFRVRGDVVDVFPAYLDSPVRIEFWGDEVEAMRKIDPVSGESLGSLDSFRIYPANQYVTGRDKMERGIAAIKQELEERVAWFEERNLLLEAQRIRMRTEYDLEMLREMGFCNGIENYSRHLGGRKPGERPWCLIDFFPKDFLLFIDESHVTVPQLGGMVKGDLSRKEKLVEHGFRLPSALDNRPLQPDEFEEVTGQTVFVSATPSPRDLERSTHVVEQLIRPTGLLDPLMEVRPIEGQVEDAISEIKKVVDEGDRVLVTTLTKRMSEDLSDYLRERKVRVEYLHSDIDAIERVEILRNLRAGEFDVLVGVNLLREGLDLPEVALVVILDADKEGFLRSETSLVQTAGRAARHEKGRVVFYADVRTVSLKNTLRKGKERRRAQMAYNKKHGIEPKSVKRGIQTSLKKEEEEKDALMVSESSGDADKVASALEKEMLEAVKKLQFERAALLRDQIDFLRTGRFDQGAKARPYRGRKYTKGKGRYGKSGK
ncbi:MAG: excinuclease ABC subunit B [Opitutae bacterium]|nr:excinuclease ABC subunit B [Opitutae bacterium]|tara:strand:+ start:1444 stop:3474 length:2031 start_codon:yes stop_codon:yes gene_type:complete